MRKHHLVATVALAVLALAAPVAHAAGDAPPRPAAGKTAKKAVKKSVRKAARKPAARQPRTASRPARSKLAAQPVRKPVTAARSVQLPSQTISAAQPRTDVRTRLTRPGDYRFALQHDGRTRTYRVHVPPGLDFHEPAPLLVALHGGSVGEQANAGLYGLARESDRQRFVTVFPDAYRAAGSRGGWNAADAGGASTDDVGFIEKVVDNVFRQLSISRLEIYAAGMADGGSMAYRLACERPHLFRAVASVGGVDPTTQCAPEKPVSVLHFAKNDAPTVLASLAGAGGGTADRGTQAAVETAAKWAKLNGCMEAPQRILDMSGAYCEAYSYCRQQTEVRLCVTDDAGPAWPGALKPGARPASHAISATSTMWGFFSSR
ncbi:MAG: CE1 family esterase [Ramlibacter sp.]